MLTPYKLTMRGDGDFKALKILTCALVREADIWVPKFLKKSTASFFGIAQFYFQILVAPRRLCDAVTERT